MPAIPLLQNAPNQPLPSALDLTRTEWSDWFLQKGGKSYHADALMQWLFAKHEVDPSKFTNLPAALRVQLNDAFDWSLPHVEAALKSEDGSVRMLLRSRDQKLYEAVVMPEINRVTLCVSCQVGCKMGCVFCQTGKLGFGRNLSAGEILAQLILANRRLQAEGEGKQVTNVVFMGMGEPLDNYDAVVEACKRMVNPKFFGLSKNRVTVSTSGLVPEIERLGNEVPVTLAISLHSPDEEERSRLMPINRKYPLSELKQVLLRYPAGSRHGITFEYVMIAGVNDSLAHAKKLVTFLHGLQAKVNLIPMNPFPGSQMRASSPETMRAFQHYLAERSIPAPVRYSRGQDVSGACGQLAAKRQEELHLSPQEVARRRRSAVRS